MLNDIRNDLFYITHVIHKYSHSSLVFVFLIFPEKIEILTMDLQLLFIKSKKGSSEKYFNLYYQP